jgi:hypothetical protein
MLSNEKKNVLKLSHPFITKTKNGKYKKYINHYVSFPDSTKKLMQVMHISNITAIIEPEMPINTLAAN